jgi:hypothetical protein
MPRRTYDGRNGRARPQQPHSDWEWLRELVARTTPQTPSDQRPPTERQPS